MHKYCYAPSLSRSYCFYLIAHYKFPIDWLIDWLPGFSETVYYKFQFSDRKSSKRAYSRENAGYMLYFIEEKIKVTADYYINGLLPK